MNVQNHGPGNKRTSLFLSSPIKNAASATAACITQSCTPRSNIDRRVGKSPEVFDGFQCWQPIHPQKPEQRAFESIEGNSQWNLGPRTVIVIISGSEPSHVIRCAVIVIIPSIASLIIKDNQLKKTSLQKVSQVRSLSTTESKYISIAAYISN